MSIGSDHQFSAQLELEPAHGLVPDVQVPEPVVGDGFDDADEAAFRHVELEASVLRGQELTRCQKLAGCQGIFDLGC